MKSTSDCAISPTHMGKSYRPLKSAKKRFLMYEYFSNIGKDEPRKYTLRRLQAAHRLRLSKGQILRGVLLKACFRWAYSLGEMSM